MVCVSTRVCTRVRTGLPEQCERMSTAQRREWHINKLTQWPERLGQTDTVFSPKQTWGWAMRKLGDLSLYHKISDKFGKRRLRQMPQPYFQDTGECKAMKPLFRQWSGMPRSIWRDSLNLQLKIPVTFPKSTCSKQPVAVALHLSENVLGTPEWEPGHRLLLVSMVSQYGYLSLPEAWPKTITTFHFSVSERGSLLCLWGPWVWGNANTLSVA